MKNRESVIYLLISLVAIAFPLSYIFNLLSDKVVFPIMFILLGVQQFYYARNIAPKDNIKLRRISIGFGILCIVFSLAVVIPKYYL